jgi:AraC-like DNA-binding protein
MRDIGGDSWDDYGFRFLENVASPAVELLAVGRQSRNSRAYDWENKERSPALLFQYTLNGSGRLQSGGQLYALKKGEAFFLQLPGDSRYYFEEESGSAPWEFIYLMMGGSGVLPYYLYARERSGEVFSLPEFHPAIAALWEIYYKAKEGRLQNAFAAGSEAFRFLCLLCASGTPISGSVPFLIERAQAYMKERYMQPITLEETAEYLGVSQSHLSREFFRYTGRQPIQYLTRLRLEAAAELLSATDKTLEEVGRCCGFSDGNYFGKVFKRHMQLSPGCFRKQARLQGYRHVKI